MNPKQERINRSAVRMLVAAGLLAAAGAVHAADYCCLCKGQTVGKTINASSHGVAVGQCILACGNFASVASGKCAEPAPAAPPAPTPGAAPTPAQAPTPTAAPAPAPPVPYAPKDFVSVAPTAKVLADDGRIRVIDFQPAAGTKLPMHAHPTMVVYLLQGGSTRFTLEDGRTIDGSAQTGDVLINPPVTHSQEHITASHAILIEIADAEFEAPAPATDLVSLAPDHCKLLKENDRLRVYEYTAKKGDRLGMHSHPAHVVYLIKAGKTQFMLQDGTTPKPGELKDGTALINPPVTHAQVHLEDVHAIIVELKQ
jgi:quercetin dioxygenase-like cupin family protein